MYIHYSHVTDEWAHERERLFVCYFDLNICICVLYYENLFVLSHSVLYTRAWGGGGGVGVRREIERRQFCSLYIMLLVHVFCDVSLLLLR